MLSEDERQQLLYRFNDSAATILPDPRALHQLFEAQAEHTPEQVAVVHEGVALSYAEFTFIRKRQKGNGLKLNLHSEISKDIQITLQQNRRGRFIHLLLAFIAPHVALDQNPVCHRGGQPFVP